MLIMPKTVKKVTKRKISGKATRGKVRPSTALLIQKTKLKGNAIKPDASVLKKKKSVKKSVKKPVKKPASKKRVNK